jgi:ferredoxin
MADKTIFRNKKSDLIRLVLLMNRQNRRFMPPMNAILQAIDLVITPEELDYLLKLGTELYSWEEALAVSGLKSEDFMPLFERLRQKAFIGVKLSENGEERYYLHPFIVGWFEGIVAYLIGRPEEKEFARRYMSLFTSLRRYNILPVRQVMNAVNRLAPVTNQSVGTVYEAKNEKGKSKIIIHEQVSVPDSGIYPASSINDMINEYGAKSLIGQFKSCMCREMTAQVDDPCRLKMPEDIACMGFGENIRVYLKYGYMRQISREEAFDIIQKARDCGAVHTVFHELDDAKLPQIGLCNCCWDCCGILRTYNLGATPLRYRCYYIANVRDIDRCTGCGRCEKYCPTAAIKVRALKAKLDPAKCIGCGQCVHQCAHFVLELVENKRTACLPMLKKSETRLSG